MLKVGLTGGIGSGKSTAVNAFKQAGAKIIDADKIARDIVEKGSEALTEIAKLFGADILLNSGELDRAKLKKIIFEKSKAGEKALADLEKITHPKIRNEIKNQILLAESEKTDYPYLIVDIPLLVEKNYQSLFDRVIVVDCTEQQQIARVKNRDNLDEKTIVEIMKQQATRDERIAAATDILDNSHDIDTLLHQVDKLHTKFERLSQS